MTFDEWWNKESHRAKYAKDHPVYLAGSEAWRAALEEAATAVEKHDVAGREWVPTSLWGKVSGEAALRIRALAASDSDGGKDD